MKNGAPSTPQVCYRCGEPGHYANNCNKRPNQNQQTPQKQNSNQKPPNYNGRVNHVSTETVRESLEVMLGTFSVNSISATVLFDSGASHSFISQTFVRTHSIPLLAMKDPMLVNSLGGGIPASYYFPSVSISLRG